MQDANEELGLLSLLKLFFICETNDPTAPRKPPDNSRTDGNVGFSGRLYTLMHFAVHVPPY